MIAIHVQYNPVPILIGHVDTAIEIRYRTKRVAEIHEKLTSIQAQKQSVCSEITTNSAADKTAKC